ncbi:hypothetical protein ACFPZ0_14515 [Streptomonospora nanhaiensis]|uniref:hypothetical protein n=1 Tax=Streptomonospora nanhaiensis TaxID=1323731 RepID=UPI001C99D07C|nr:hypothetical protein [Streptomonospora nanhaiensis]MBX9390607.1 hypothetical protein [Streptomonospora nanhaiensis]
MSDGEASPRAWWEPPRLTDDELDRLRVRLNDAPDAQLNEAERWARYELGVIRMPEAVEKLAARVRREALDADPSATSRDYAAGILDTIEWARGEHREAPVTGQRPKGRLPATADLEREGGDAAEALSGQLDRRGLSTSYISGVEATCLWLVCLGPDPWT